LRKLVAIHCLISLKQWMTRDMSGLGECTSKAITTTLNVTKLTLI
jgi:hypothetical protein